MCECAVYLWDDGEFGPQVVQADLRYLHLVDGDLSRCGFQQPEEAQRHGRLARPCATHDADLYANIHRAKVGEAVLATHTPAYGMNQRDLPTFSPPLTLSVSCFRTRSSPSLYRTL